MVRSFLNPAHQSTDMSFLSFRARARRCAPNSSSGAVLRRYGLGLMMAFLAGCGGGGTSSGGDPGPGPGPGGGGQYSVAERSAATGRIAAKYEELMAAATPQPLEALRAYVMTQPEFADAGVGDGELWAKFTDGRYFLYLDNWKNVPPDQVESLPVAAPAPAGARAGQVVSKGEVPTSNKVLMLKLDADDFWRGEESFPRTAKALEAQGWEMIPGRRLTVQALLNQGELGIMYLNSHAGRYGPGSNKHFAVITETLMNDTNEEMYKADLADGSLIMTRERHIWQKYGFDREPYYAFTEGFVAKHMKFSSQSLVVMMMCNVGSEQGSAIRDALTAAGAGTIVAWNGSANAHGYAAVDLMFDRLTGANRFEPASPGNRAFAFDDVFSYLSQTGRLLQPGIEGEEASFIKRFGNNFDLSNPIITQMQAAWQDKLIIHGDFGSEPGSVTVGGTPLAASWAADKVEVTLPTGAGDPAGSHGEVVVTARGRKSNARTLTSWRGTVTYLWEDLDPDGILSNKIEVDLHLRADPYARRTLVNGNLLNNTWNVLPASDTKARWSAAGSRNAGIGVKTWSGRGDLTMVGPPIQLGAPQLLLFARIDAVEQRLELSPVIPTAQLVTISETDSPTFQRGLIFPANLFGFMNQTGNFADHNPLVYGTYVPLDGQRNVAGSQKVINSPNGDSRLTVTRSAMTASPAFDDRLGR